MLLFGAIGCLFGRYSAIIRCQLCVLACLDEMAITMCAKLFHFKLRQI